MIDNQADYDEIFRGKARLPRSPSHQGVSAAAIVPPSSSAGFPIQAPSPTDVAPVKPKSPPLQVSLTRVSYVYEFENIISHKRSIN